MREGFFHIALFLLLPDVADDQSRKRREKFEMYIKYYIPAIIIKKRQKISTIGNVHKGRPTIMGHFGNTYLPMSDVFYTMPIALVRFLLRYLLTPKSDVH